MKRLCYTLAVLTLLIAAIVTLNACGDTDATTASTTTTAPITTTAPVTTEAPIPEGYTEYKNGNIVFAYPKTWVKQDGSTVLLQDATTGNNVTVAYEDKNDYYSTLTLAGYNRDMKPAFEAMGLTISDPSVKQTTNKAGTAITKISHTATVSGVSMKQTMLIATFGNKTYTVTVTEVKPDQALVDTVFDTYRAK